MPSLRIEGQPYEFSGVRTVSILHQDSLPTGLPQSISLWRFFGLIRETNSFKSYLRLTDRSTILPSPFISSDNRSPSASRAPFTISPGILIARLFPHFETRVSVGIVSTLTIHHFQCLAAPFTSHAITRCLPSFHPLPRQQARVGPPQERAVPQSRGGPETEGSRPCRTGNPSFPDPTSQNRK